MGAEQFTITQVAASATEAFRDAVDQAEHDHGHRGYTGTIAEKGDFVVVHDGDPLEYADAVALAARLLAADDDRIDDKWGPAGCIPMTGNRYLFLGWASS